MCACIKCIICMCVVCHTYLYVCVQIHILISQLIITRFKCGEEAGADSHSAPERVLFLAFSPQLLSPFSFFYPSGFWLQVPHRCCLLLGFVFTSVLVLHLSLLTLVFDSVSESPCCLKQNFPKDFHKNQFRECCGN